MPSFEATLTSKGQITIPVKLRARLNLKAGDKVEFFLDGSGRVSMRSRNLSATAVFEKTSIGDRKAPDMTDDEAIIAAVLEKDRRSRRRGRVA
jgi:AbrB family looped-hinge helix DNA binding protein